MGMSFMRLGTTPTHGLLHWTWSKLAHIEGEGVAAERSERGEGREVAGCSVPGSMPTELEAKHGGG